MKPDLWDRRMGVLKCVEYEWGMGSEAITVDVSQDTTIEEGWQLATLHCIAP